MLQTKSETGGGRNAVLTQVTQALLANHPIGGDRSRVSPESSHRVIFHVDARTGCRHSGDPQTQPPPTPARGTGGGRAHAGLLAALPALDPGLAQQLAVLLLRHALAAL